MTGGAECSDPQLLNWYVNVTQAHLSHVLLATGVCRQRVCSSLLLIRHIVGLL